MRKGLLALTVLCVFAPAIGASTRRPDLERPIPMAARRLAIHGADLVARDAIDQGLSLLRRSISLAPNYIWAHQQYFAARAYHRSEYDQVRAEYERLMVREPDNPIYVLVIAETARVPSDEVRPLLERVIKLAPDWAWAHYARAILSGGSKGIAELDQATKEVMLTELSKCIELDETAAPAYHSLAYILREGFGRSDQAIGTYEKLTAQPEFEVAGLHQLWNARLSKGSGSDKAKASLRAELVRRSATSKDVEMLAGVRAAYLELLNDAAGADQVERQIRRLDPGWYPERGKTLFIAGTTEGGISRPLMVANRQFSIFQQVEKIDDREPRERITALKRVLSLNPGREIRIYIYQRILRAAEKIKDQSTFVRFGEGLRALESEDTGIVSKIAIALADQKTDLKKALAYAHLAERETSDLRPVRRPRNAPPEWFAWSFPERRWRDNHKRQKARALDAVGWVLYQMENYAAAEEKLRQSCALIRSERSLTHLSLALKKLGRVEEGEMIARDADNLWLDSIRRRFIKQPSTDFQLEGLARPEV